MESAYLLFFKFILDHSDMELIINYDPVLKGVSFTMNAYSKRKRVVFYPEAIEQSSLDAGSIILEYLENMYKELSESNKEEK